MQTTSKTIKLRNGLDMPVFSLGTAHTATNNFFPDGNKSIPFVGFLPEKAYRQVEVALQQGIRSFDTGLFYRSQEPLGSVLSSWWRDGKLSDRKEVFVTSKVFMFPMTTYGLQVDHPYNLEEMTVEETEAVMRRHVERCLSDLRLGYIDLMLLHWPSNPGSKDEAMSRKRRFAAWKVLEEYYNKGWLRSIGVSNFSIKHLQQLNEDGASIVPMVNQIEASPFIQYKDIVEYCQKNEIVVEAFSPLGSGLKNIFADQTLMDVATKNNKTVAQIVFRYLIQLGYAITYKTTSEVRMVSNECVFDFELSKEDMEKINALNSPDGNWGLPRPYDLL